jgi:hypothetical protein
LEVGRLIDGRRHDRRALLEIEHPIPPMPSMPVQPAAKAVEERGVLRFSDSQR